MMKPILYIVVLLAISAGSLFSQISVNQTDKKGKKQGLWRKNYDDGIIRYEGSFKDDQPDGIFRYYNELGKIKMVCFYYEKGKKSRAKGFDNEGNMISSGNYFGKEKDSVWTYYDASKSPIARESWSKGIKNGQEITYYPNGQISEELGWKEGKKNGPWTQYYDDGKKRLTANYSMGLLNGKQTYYFPNEKVKLVGNYVNDLREGTWIQYEENGNLKGTEVFKNGISEKPILIDTEKPDDEIKEPMPGQ